MSLWSGFATNVRSTDTALEKLVRLLRGTFPLLVVSVRRISYVDMSSSRLEDDFRIDIKLPDRPEYLRQGYVTQYELIAFLRLLVRNIYAVEAFDRVGPRKESYQDLYLQHQYHTGGTYRWGAGTGGLTQESPAQRARRFYRDAYGDENVEYCIETMRVMLYNRHTSERFYLPVDSGLASPPVMPFPPRQPIAMGVGCVIMGGVVYPTGRDNSFVAYGGGGGGGVMYDNLGGASGIRHTTTISGTGNTSFTITNAYVTSDGVHPARLFAGDVREPRDNEQD